MQLASFFIFDQVMNALEEDLNKSVDLTGNLIRASRTVMAGIRTNEEMVLCGREFLNTAFLACDKNAKILWHFKDGDVVKPRNVLCTVEGNARGVLTAERTALNFVQTLSGTATMVREFVEMVKLTKVKIMDTRKTIPGLRLAQKYAVVVGGGYNQRVGLYDGVLIKENHIMACGSVRNALNDAFEMTPEGVPIQIEIENYDQFVEALDAKAKLVLLDNMSIAETEKCVQYNKGRAELEVSGNISLDNVLAYAKTGVDRISLGCITKNIRAIDLSMRVINNI